MSAHAQSSARPQTLIGTYHATIGGTTERRDGATTTLILNEDGRYIVTLGNNRDTSRFRGHWHRNGDKIVFEDVASDPAITLAKAGGWNDIAQGHAQSADTGSLVAIAFTPVDDPNLVLDPEAMTITVHFNDGKTSTARVDTGTSWAIADDLGDVQTIEVTSKSGQGDGHVAVPVSSDDARDRVFTLRMHPIVMTVGQEPPPPLTIDGKALTFGKSMRFVRGAE